MADDLNAFRDLNLAMAVMKMEPLRLERVDHLDVAAQLAIVVSRYDHDVTTVGKSLQKPGRFSGRGLIMHQVAQNDEALRLVLADKRLQSVRDRRHPPQGNQMPGCALAQFVAKMHVRNRQPAFGFVEKSEPAIEKNFIGHESLVCA